MILLYCTQPRMTVLFLTRKCLRAQTVAQPSYETHRQGITNAGRKEKNQVVFCLYVKAYAPTPDRLLVESFPKAEKSSSYF